MHHLDPFARLMAEVLYTRGWSHRRLAREVGVHHVTVGRWLNGESTPTPALQASLSDLLGLPTGVPSGEEIREVRFRLGKTQCEFAHLLGSSQSMLSKIERGLQGPSVEIIRRLKEVGLQQVRACDLSGADLEACAASYEAYWRACAVYDRPDAVAWGCALTRRLRRLVEEDPQARGLLARVYASRAYWHLARGHYKDAEHAAILAIQAGSRGGYDATSGYAFWVLARVRFQRRRVSEADREVVRRLRQRAFSSLGTRSPYGELVATADERMNQRWEEADERLEALGELAFPRESHGQFGRFLRDPQSRTIYGYRVMFRLASRRNKEVVAMTEGCHGADDVPSLTLSAYRAAALKRLGSPDLATERSIAERAEASNLGFAYGTIALHVRGIAGVEPQAIV